MSWTLGHCSSSQRYEDFKQYDEKCCLSPGLHTLVCINTEKPEGWKKGYIAFQGHRYCDDFMAFKAMRRIQVKDMHDVKGLYMQSVRVVYG